MLAEWWKNWNGEKPVEAAEGAADLNEAQRKRAEHLRRLREDVVPIHAEPSEAEKEVTREKSVKQKLRASAKEAARGVGPQNSLSYDSMFRGLQGLMMAGGGEESEGVAVNVMRPVQNCQVSSKWNVGNPQSAGWELSLQMNGFSEVTAATYSTLGRLMLMHQRSFKSGALGVMQFMAQPEAMAQGQPPTLFAMLQYPWLRGSCSQVTYLRPQHVQLSHTAKLIRGVTLGANMTYDLMGGSTSMQYGAHTVSVDKSVEWFGQVSPDAGTWKVGMTKQDWANDSEMGVQLEMAEKRAGGMAAMMGGGGPPELQSALTLALRKHFIGGASVHAALTNFSKLKAELELPFGGNRPMLNQGVVQYSIQYDAHTGGAKHGLSLNL